MSDPTHRVPSAPGRRTVLHAAWAAPAVVVASAVPAFAASGRAPSLNLSAFDLDDSYAYATVVYSRPDTTDLTQSFDYQGLPEAGPWETFAAGRSTNSSGYAAETFARAAIGRYAEIRASALVPGYGLVLSNSVQVADIWT